MDCKGKCVDKKKALGPAVFFVDGKPLCATCFESWMERSGTAFDQHRIVRMDNAPETHFELHKGPTTPRKRTEQCLRKSLVSA